MGIWAKIEKQMRCKLDFSNAALVNFHDTGSRQLLINWKKKHLPSVLATFAKCFTDVS